jgi:putative membrane protein
MNTTVEKKYNKWIIILSILIPVAVALLFVVKLKDLGFDVSPLPFLPPIYATINAITAILLITAVLAIKNGKVHLHQNLMKLAIVCSLLFLVMYIVYHMTTPSTKFGGEGAIKYVYYSSC